MSGNSSAVLVLRTVVVTKLLVSGILFSTSLIFIFKTVVVTKPVASRIFYQHLHFFSNFCLSILFWLVWIKVVPSEMFLSKLFTFVYSVSNLVFLTTSLSISLLIFFKSKETVLNYQHLNHLLLFLNYLN